jgi:hypothetical protein
MINLGFRKLWWKDCTLTSGVNYGFEDSKMEKYSWVLDEIIGPFMAWIPDRRD